MKKNSIQKNKAKLLIEFAEKKGLLTIEQAREASLKNISSFADIENLISSNGWMIPQELEALFKNYARYTLNHSDIQFGKIAVHNKFISKPIFDEILIQQKINSSRDGQEQYIGDLLISKKLLTKQQVEAILKIQNQLDEEVISNIEQKINLEQKNEIKKYKDLIHQHDKDKTVQDFHKIFPEKDNLAIQYAQDIVGFEKYIRNRLKGHYEIIEVYHQKSIFFTALSNDLNLNKKVVVKILKPGLHFSFETAVTYLEEILHLAGIHHKNLVEIVDFGFIDCFPYMSHLYIEGESLNNYFQNHEATLKNKVDHFLTICDALEHLHQKLIWHKNLSSGNLIITKEDVPVFLNYGISKTIKTKTSVSEYNQKIDLVIESLNYMSPEEASGKFEEMNECSEIYSLGVILYELCTSQLPYDIQQCDIFLALTKIREELPWPPSIYNTEIPPPLEWIILKALAKEKSHRYQFVSELKLDINNFLIGAEVSAKPVVEETDALTIHDLKSKYAFHFRILSGVIVALLIAIAILASMPSKDELKEQLLFNKPNKAIQRQAQFASEKKIPIKYENSTGIKFVLIPPGAFEMGSPEKELFRMEDEILHEINLSDGFYLSETEITQLQWEQIMKSNPSEFKGGNLPVENISWVDTQKFINELSAKTNQRYRLPTEAEWEFACRAGSMLPFNLDEKDSVYAWDKLSSNQQTHPVKLLKPNAFGLYDMHNNVWEWCQDYYDNYDTTQTKNPQGPLSGIEKIMRGGSFTSLKASSRSATRRSRKPDYISSSLGFRILLELETKNTTKN